VFVAKKKGKKRVHANRVRVTLSGGDEGEVEHDGLGLHGVVPSDGVGDVAEPVGVAADEDDAEAPARELQGHGPADAGRRAGDHGPRAVAAAEVRRPAQEAGEAEAVQETERDSGEVEGAEDGQREETPLPEVVGGDVHLSLSLALPACRALYLAQLARYCNKAGADGVPAPCRPGPR
jgi:hypothetical protein